MAHRTYSDSKHRLGKNMANKEITVKKEVIVIDSMASEKAKSLFAKWANANRLILNVLGEKDLIVDQIQGPQGQTLIRYRIFID